MTGFVLKIDGVVIAFSCNQSVAIYGGALSSFSSIQMLWILRMLLMQSVYGLCFHV